MICPVQIIREVSALRAARVGDHRRHGFLLTGRDGAGNEGTGSDFAGLAKNHDVPSRGALPPNAVAASPTRTRSDCPLSPRQTAPYVAFCGCAVTIVSEDSPDCGQAGRVRRVFWRERMPFVLVRLRIGGMRAVPWNWTDLPGLPMEQNPSSDGRLTALLSPTGLRDLVHFLGSYGANPNKRHSNA
jgi:hypothetical protein